MFSPSFVSVHKRLAPAIPIGRFASYVNPQAIGFNSDKDFYAPIQFSVQVADGVTGALRMDVPIQKNPNWRSDMKEQLQKMISFASSFISIELKTITGMNLDKVPDNAVGQVGKLNVYDAKTGQLIRLPSLPEVPAEYRVTKVADLHQWAQKLSDYIPEAVAGALKGKDKHEVEEALRIDGLVQQSIENKIKDTASFGWNEFVRLHQSNSSKAQIPKEEAQKLLRKVSKQILTYVRSFVGAASEQVNLHIASEQAKKTKPNVLNKEDEHLLKPILSQAPNIIQNNGREGGEKVHSHSLFQNLVEDALSMPTLQKSLVASIYNFDINSSASSYSSYNSNKIASVRPAMKRIVSVSNHHPMNAHIHHTLLPLRGTYPADYIVRHTRQDMSAKAPFVGDATKVYEAYHKFSGAHPAPPPLKIKGGVPIECHHPSKKKTHPREQKDEEYVNSSITPSGMPKLIPIGGEASTTPSGMPKLIPIGGEAPKTTPSSMPKLIPIGGFASTTPSNMPKLIPIGGEASTTPSSMPKLIPIGDDLIGCHQRRHSSSSSSSDGEEEIREMIGGHYSRMSKKSGGKKKGHHRRRSSGSSYSSDGDDMIGSAMPPLIPISSSTSSSTSTFSTKIEGAVERNLPRLIPISSDVGEEEIDAPVTQDEYAHLPSVDDVFK